MTMIELNDATASTCEVKFFDGDSVMYGNGILYKNLMSGDNHYIYRLQYPNRCNLFR